MNPAECRNGHDLSVLGKTKQGLCVACKTASRARYASSPRYRARYERYNSSLTGMRSKLQYDIRAKEVRITALKEMLHA